MLANEAISCDNRGYLMLQRMGWTPGRGLGKDGTGIVEPIRLAINDSFLGLGKATEYNEMAEEATETRRALTNEILLGEEGDEAACQERLRRNAEDARIQLALKDAVSEFLCELCRKAYKTAMEYSAHLDSYDHHHVKRFKEMCAVEAMRKRHDREAKEARKTQRAERTRETQPEQGGQGADAQPQIEAHAVPAPAPVVLGQEGAAPFKFAVGAMGKKGGGVSRAKPATGFAFGE